MNELLVKNENVAIKDLIYEIRGTQVMLDSDLAELYQVETKRINEAVYRNQEKFPERFCFKLNNQDLHNLWSQNATANISKKSRNNPTVFTEQGVYMLATILKSKVATQVTINIMDAFVILKNYISNSLIENRYYKEMLLTHDKDIKMLKEQFKTKNNHLFFEGQIYDAYSLLIDIFNLSKISITIIDNYLDKSLLDILSKTDKQILIITNKYNNADYNKYCKQYKNVTLKLDNSFHDRYIIIDNEILYHCGASFKDLGNKCFSITKMEDDEILKSLLNKIKN